MSVIDVGLNSALKHHRLTMGVAQYRGQGRCRQVMCYGDATLTDLHIHELRRWAQKINWKVTNNNQHEFTIERKAAEEENTPEGDGLG